MLTVTTEHPPTDNDRPSIAGTSVDILHDIPETAHILRCGRSTVYELVKAGELASIKIGRRRLVTHDSLLEFVRRASVAS